MTAAMAQMAPSYGLPFFGTAGATDATFGDAKTFEPRLQEATPKKMAHRPPPLPEETPKILDEMPKSWQ